VLKWPNAYTSKQRTTVCHALGLNSQSQDDPFPFTTIPTHIPLSQGFRQARLLASSISPADSSREHCTMLVISTYPATSHLGYLFRFSEDQISPSWSVSHAALSCFWVAINEYSSFTFPLHVLCVDRFVLHSFPPEDCHSQALPLKDISATTLLGIPPSLLA